MADPTAPAGYVISEEIMALARAIVREMTRRAGATKSPARAAASRRNGKLGGRPRKQKTPEATS